MLAWMSVGAAMLISMNPPPRARARHQDCEARGGSSHRVAERHQQQPDGAVRRAPKLSARTPAHRAQGQAHQVEAGQDDRRFRQVEAEFPSDQGQGRRGLAGLHRAQDARRPWPSTRQASHPAACRQFLQSSRGRPAAWLNSVPSCLAGLSLWWVRARDLPRAFLPVPGTRAAHVHFRRLPCKAVGEGLRRRRIRRCLPVGCRWT